MPIFVYRCSMCGRVQEQVELAPGVLPPLCNCMEPSGHAIIMRRIPGAPNFTITGYSAQNGYSK